MKKKNYISIQLNSAPYLYTGAVWACVLCNLIVTASVNTSSLFTAVYLSTPPSAMTSTAHQWETPWHVVSLYPRRLGRWLNKLRATVVNSTGSSFKKGHGHPKKDPWPSWESIQHPCDSKSLLLTQWHNEHSKCFQFKCCWTWTTNFDD